MKPGLNLVAALTFTASASVFAQCNSQIQATAPASRFVIHDDATVTDTTTGLMWKRCTEGYQWENSVCAEDAQVANSYTWSEALTSTAGHEFAGFNDWRMPNKIELASIVEYNCFEPAINGSVFPGTPVESFWSNTPNYFNIRFAWAINFAQGEHTTTARTNPFAVRLVRDVNQ